MNFLLRTRFLVIVIVVQAVLLISILATFGYRVYRYNQINRDNRVISRGNAQQPGDVMAKSLKLSSTQRQEFRQFRAQFRGTMDSLQVQSRNASKRLTEELVKDTPNWSAVDSLIELLGELEKSQKRALVQHFVQVKSNCTPEQQLRFNKFIQRMNDYGYRKNREFDRNRREPRNRNNSRNN